PMQASFARVLSEPKPYFLRKYSAASERRTKAVSGLFGTLAICIAVPCVDAKFRTALNIGHAFYFCINETLHELPSLPCSAAGIELVKALAQFCSYALFVKRWQIFGGRNGMFDITSACSHLF